MKRLLALGACLFMTSCTQTITMAHTSGSAEDLIDETTTSTPTVSPTVTVPLTPGSSMSITK